MGERLFLRVLFPIVLLVLPVIRPDLFLDSCSWELVRARENKSLAWTRLRISVMDKDVKDTLPLSVILATL